MSNISLHEADLSLNHIFFSQFSGNFLVHNVLISMKKEVVDQKSYFTAMQI